MRCLCLSSSSLLVVGVVTVTTTVNNTLFATVINVPGDFANIQPAINAAADGDEIIVGPGVYNTTINFGGKAITLRSENVNDPGLTTINGGAAGSVVTFNAGEGPDSKLAGFTIVNGAANTGGGAFVGAGTNPTIENCNFEGSQAQNGGGIAVLGQVTLRECWFLGNVANTSGGGLHSATTSSNVMLHACRFEGNDSPTGSGLRLLGPATVVNTEVFDNVNGPAVTISGAAPVSLINCNVVNHATAGIVLNAGATSPTTIANCNVLNNAAQITGPAAMLNVRFSNVQGGFAGPGNINVNPQFVDPAFDNFRLLPTSPCIDAGENASLPAGVIEDFDGFDRVSDRASVVDSGSGTAPIVDIGAHEFPPPRRYVNASATGLDHGKSWSNAYLDLQDALQDATVVGSEITEVWVAAGTYWPDGGTGDRTLSFDMISGVEIIGGFVGGETDLSQNDPAANETILSGAIGAAGQTDNSYHVVRASNVDSTGKLIGFTVQRGYADGFGDSLGGGIFIEFGAPAIRECWVRNNFAEVGGGLFCVDADSNIVRSRFSLNEATQGGGMTFWAGSTQVINCLVSGNESVDEGGAIYIVNPAITEITNCTIIGNTATSDSGGGVVCNGDATVTNTILWQNVGSIGTTEAQQFRIFGGGTSAINYCTVQDWSGVLPGIANLATNPQFVDANGPDALPGTADDDAHLEPGSTCIDSADSDALPAVFTFDLDGNERFIDDSATPNSGAGAIAYLDRGAYEFAAPCPADTNGSGSVDVDDLIAVILGWGVCPGSPAPCPADTNGSGDVDVDDLIAVILAWGACP